MKRTITGTAVLATVIVTALTSAACGSGGGSADNSASVDPNSVSGTITWWDTSDATNEAPVYQAA